uniref:Uncharacterized protein n=1 Tax=Octopus bimaculoides TaxID=37653 RepID=A0A0L8GA04_OCTBM
MAYSICSLVSLFLLLNIYLNVTSLKNLSERYEFCKARSKLPVIWNHIPVSVPDWIFFPFTYTSNSLQKDILVATSHSSLSQNIRFWCLVQRNQYSLFIF